MKIWVGIAPCDVPVSAQNTGLGPEKTPSFQALSITTKISRDTIEILNDLRLIKENDEVGASENTLLNMLDIFPISYDLMIEQVFNSGLSMRVSGKPFMKTLIGAASLSLAIAYPAMASAKQTYPSFCDRTWVGFLTFPMLHGRFIYLFGKN